MRRRAALSDGPQTAAAQEPAAPTAKTSAPLTRALLAAVGSRLLIFVAAFAAISAIGVLELPPGWRFPARAEVFHGFLGRLLNPWAHWDGVWFIKIATSGYADGDGSTAFFPLYPLLLRWVGILFSNNLVITGVVISLICYTGCVWLLYRLVRSDFDEVIASRAVIFLALGPLSFFLQAVYTESLFLMLSLACFVFAREGRWRLAGLAGLLATLTRSTGVLLLVPMAYYYYEQRGWRLWRTDSKVANLLMVVEGLLIWMAYLSLTFGKPLLFSTAQAAWHRSPAAPNYAVAKGIAAGVWGCAQLVWYGISHFASRLEPATLGLGHAVNNLINLAFFVPAALLLWYGARRLPRAYSWYALAALAYPLFFPSSVVPLMSYPRFALTTFPLYVALALWTRDKPRLHTTVLIVGTILLVVLTGKFAVFSWVS